MFDGGRVCPPRIFHVSMVPFYMLKKRTMRRCNCAAAARPCPEANFSNDDGWKPVGDHLENINSQDHCHTSMYVVGHIRAISSNFFPLSYFTKCFMQYCYFFKKIRENTDGGK